MLLSAWLQFADGGMRQVEGKLFNPGRQPALYSEVPEAVDRGAGEEPGAGCRRAFESRRLLA